MQYNAAVFSCREISDESSPLRSRRDDDENGANLDALNPSQDYPSTIGIFWYRFWNALSLLYIIVVLLLTPISGKSVMTC